MPSAGAARWAMIALVFLLSGCFDDGSANAYFEINLYSGIRGLANLGDSWSQISHTNTFRTKQLELPNTANMEMIKFSDAYSIPGLGVRLYFRDGRVALIEIQEPFKGTIQGKTIKLFEFKPPPGKSWEDVLIMNFGPPIARAAGGRLGSEAAFYSWGDISYNRMGTNEIGIYRDPAISQYRQRHFGRDIGSVFEK